MNDRENETETLRFVEPDASMLPAFAAYRQAFLDAGSPLGGCASLADTEDMAVWFRQIQALADERTVPEGWVRSTQFALLRGDRVLGTLQVRHRFNDFLRDYGGHIGYSVRPSERRRGYATLMLQQALAYCGEIGLHKALITCLETNEGSRRTILKCGGVYESTVIEPRKGQRMERYWITVKTDGAARTDL